MLVDIYAYGGFYGYGVVRNILQGGAAASAASASSALAGSGMVAAAGVLASAGNTSACTEAIAAATSLLAAAQVAENSAEYYDAYALSQAAAALVQMPSILYTTPVNPLTWWSTGTVDSIFLAAAIIYLVNACQFAYAWYDRFWYEVVLLPEYLNVVAACLRLVAASMYPKTNAAVAAGDFSAPGVMKLHYVETAAAAVELIAALGWTATWIITFRRRPGRGYTLDDPDLTATLCTLMPAATYLAYDIQVLLDPPAYATNALHIVADAGYLAGAVAYFLGAMRDDGYFWFMPTSGRWPAAFPGHPTCLHVEGHWPARKFGDDDDDEFDDGSYNSYAGDGGAEARADAEFAAKAAAAAAAAAATSAARAYSRRGSSSQSSSPLPRVPSMRVSSRPSIVVGSGAAGIGPLDAFRSPNSRLDNDPQAHIRRGSQSPRRILSTNELVP